jgi:hypothetical protein
MTDDLFQFWSPISDNAHVHPADACVLSRVPHGFNLGCLPASYFGPLRTAAVVLLFLSPGYEPSDEEYAGTAEGRAYYKRQRTGLASLPSGTEQVSSHRWWTGIVRQFSTEPEAHAKKIAILNIGAYHSVQFTDWSILMALPSSRAAVEFAQRVLFPEAESGERVVVCMRSAHRWGLSIGADRGGRRFGEALLVPRCTRGGFMNHGEFREEVVRKVRSALGVTED